MEKRTAVSALSLSLLAWTGLLLASGLLGETASAQDAVVSPPALVGNPAFDFTLSGADGKLASLKDHQGKVILLSFWDCHADTCFTSTRAFDDLRAAYPPEKLVLLTVCYEIPPGMAANNYQNLLRNCYKGQVLLIDQDRMVMRLYQVQEGPTTFVIDREMIVRERIEGVPGLRTREFAGRVGALVGAGAQK